jgi:alkylated DNA repair dioxygenase AlkB
MSTWVQLVRAFNRTFTTTIYPNSQLSPLKVTDWEKLWVSVRGQKFLPLVEDSDALIPISITAGTDITDAKCERQIGLPKKSVLCVLYWVLDAPNTLRIPVLPSLSLPVEHSAVSGLFYLDNFCTLQQSEQLLSLIEQEPWSANLARPTQHYGHTYDYTSSSIKPASPLPAFAQFLIEQLMVTGLFTAYPDQLIINKYAPGQGIAAHTDHEKLFGAEVASISLGSTVLMDFGHKASKKVVNVPLLPCSLVVLTKAARYDWTHSIASRKSDVLSGVRQQRSERVSLTFRYLRK